MRVAVNARNLHSPSLRGWNRYSVNLLRELPSCGVELYLYTDAPLHQSHLDFLPEGQYVIRTASKMRYVWWEQAWVPGQCAADQVEVFHSPFNFGLPGRSCCPRVLTLHDIIDRHELSEAATHRLSLNAIKTLAHLWVAQKSASHVITVSHYAKRQIVEELGVPEMKVTVIHEAADPRFHRAISDDDRKRVTERFGLHDPYVFYVGGFEERKNVPYLIRMFAAANLGDVELVLAGQVSTANADLHAAAGAAGISHRFRVLGWVDEQDLAALYSGALCFVYPSTAEGFGLQLCESMAVGCPTLAANATSLPEVLGGGGETFPLGNPCAAADVLRVVVGDSAYRAELSTRARKRSAELSWKLVAEKTVDVYRRVLEEA